MRQALTFETVRREMLLRSIYLLFAPVFLLFAVLACVGTVLPDRAVYVCPSPIPATAAPTVLPGTPLPPPTKLPPTPFVITPPQDFYVGDVVFIGAAGAPVRVRLRLQAVRTYPAAPAGGQSRRIYAWALEVKNAGTQNYEIFPAVQLYLSVVTTASGESTGVWGATQAAADEAGLTLDDNFYTLIPGETRTFRFAAYAPAGSARRFTFTLDPTVTQGSPVITWINQTNPSCTGDIAG
jgi:hypothetical protein